jgi:hypothetical protein
VRPRSKSITCLRCQLVEQRPTYMHESGVCPLGVLQRRMPYSVARERTRSRSNVGCSESAAASNQPVRGAGSSYPRACSSATIRSDSAPRLWAAAATSVQPLGDSPSRSDHLDSPAHPLCWLGSPRSCNKSKPAMRYEIAQMARPKERVSVSAVVTPKWCGWLSRR